MNSSSFRIFSSLLPSSSSFLSFPSIALLILNRISLFLNMIPVIASFLDPKSIFLSKEFSVQCLMWIIFLILLFFSFRLSLLKTNHFIISFFLSFKKKEYILCITYCNCCQVYEGCDPSGRSQGVRERWTRK